MVDQCDQDSFNVRAYFFDTNSYRYTHLAIRIGIVSKTDVKTLQLLSNIVGAVPDDDNDSLIDSGSAQVLDAGFDHSLIAEGKQRFELSHSARASGGKQDGSDVLHAES